MPFLLLGVFFSALEQSLRGRVGNFFGMWKTIEWCTNVGLLGRFKGSTHTYIFFFAYQTIIYRTPGCHRTPRFDNLPFGKQWLCAHKWFLGSKWHYFWNFLKDMVFLGRNRYSWQCTCQKKRCAWQASWNPNFTPMESLQFSRFS